MDEERLKEIRRLQSESMRALSLEELEELSRRQSAGMRAVSMEELAKMQGDYMRAAPQTDMQSAHYNNAANLWPTEPIKWPEPKPSVWRRIVNWIRGE
jgi:hypothetical protein